MINMILKQNDSKLVMITMQIKKWLSTEILWLSTHTVLITVHNNRIFKKTEEIYGWKDIHEFLQVDKLTMSCNPYHYYSFLYYAVTS